MNEFVKSLKNIFRLYLGFGVVAEFSVIKSVTNQLIDSHIFVNLMSRENVIGYSLGYGVIITIIIIISLYISSHYKKYSRRIHIYYGLFFISFLYAWIGIPYQSIKSSYSSYFFINNECHDLLYFNEKYTISKSGYIYNTKDIDYIKKNTKKDSQAKNCLGIKIEEKNEEIIRILQNFSK